MNNICDRKRGEGCLGTGQAVILPKMGYWKYCRCDVGKALEQYQRSPLADDEAAWTSKMERENINDR